jgi:DNA-binding YbaB/EbfC family protein
MKNLAGLMKQASQMQSKMEEMQAGLATIEVEGSAGAGMVMVTLTGKGDLAETEMLEDLIVAAHAEARRHLETRTAEEMQKVTGGLNLPPGLKLPF